MLVVKCHCKECPTCKNREYMRQYRAKKLESIRRQNLHRRGGLFEDDSAIVHAAAEYLEM